MFLDNEWDTKYRWLGTLSYWLCCK